MYETQVLSLSGEGPLEKVMATHYSIFAWRVPWTEESGGLQFSGYRDGHNWAVDPFTFQTQDDVVFLLCYLLSFFFVCLFWFGFGGRGV